MDEQKKDPLAEAEARVERLAERVIIPETLAPNATMKLFGHDIQARALPMKFTKRLHAATKDLWLQVSEVIAVRDGTPEEKAKVLDRFPNLHDDAASALVRAVEIIAEFYKVPGVTPDGIEAEYTVSQMLKIVGFQVSLNEADDFLLQPLRLTVVVMGSIPVLASAIRVHDSPASPSSTPGPRPGESPSKS